MLNYWRTQNVSNSVISRLLFARDAAGCKRPLMSSGVCVSVSVSVCLSAARLVRYRQRPRYAAKRTPLRATSLLLLIVLLYLRSLYAFCLKFVFGIILFDRSASIVRLIKIFNEPDCFFFLFFFLVLLDKSQGGSLFVLGALQSLRLSEETRERLEEELRSLVRDRDELADRFSVVSRQKSALAEELISSRAELERQGETVVLLTKDREELTKEKAELAVRVTACERENRQQGQVGEKSL